MTDTILFLVLIALTLIQIVRVDIIDNQYRKERGRDTERNRKQ